MDLPEPGHELMALSLLASDGKLALEYGLANDAVVQAVGHLCVRRARNLLAGEQ